MLSERTNEHSKRLEVLRVNVDKLKETKQDKSNFQEQKMQIQGQFDTVNKSLDE